MAIKDWKKKTLEKEHFVFFNDKNGRRIYIAKQTYGNKWYVEFDWMTHKYKLFNTKSQALRYAKSYMRKN